MNLTKNQQLMLDVERVSGGSINVICGSVIIDKKLDIDTMSRAVNELFRINDALRIKLISQNGIVSQVIENFEQKNIEVIKLSKKSEVHQYAQEQAHIPLDINNTLCEIKVIVSETFSGILYKLHHIISDAWTLSLLATQFNRIINGEKVTAYSYKDHIEVDNQYFLGNRYLKDKLFYVEQFKKQPEPVFLSEKAVVKNCAKRKSFSLDCKKVKLVEKFLEKNKISPAVLFLAIISVYYNKITNNSESFYIGMPVVNRTGLVEKNTAGLFINTAPVLIELRNQSAFLENVAKIEETVMSAMRHQKYTYEDILTALNDNFGFTGKLFDLIFSYQNAQIYGDLFESTWYHNGMQRESLQIHFDDRDNLGVLKIHYDYQVEKFSDNDIDRLHGHICNLLFDAIENPDKNICDLEMLSSEEKNKLLYKFNDTAKSYSVDGSSTIYSLFEQTAKANRSKVCLTVADKSITYDELLSIAERLDNKIRSITENKKSIIAIIAERSIEMYSAIYGIIRGGNAYLPIVPEYPQERIDYILKNSGAAAVVTQSKFMHLAGNIPCVDMTTFIDNSSVESVAVQPCAAQENDTAYVIYTSGSTGNPKGAKVTHKSVVNRILWMHDKYILESDGVILQKTPFTFDVSVWEIFWWGMCGGSLVAAKPGEHFLPEKILNETYKNCVTHLHFVPSVFDLFLNYLEAHRDEVYKFHTVKHVFLSGEALTASLIQRFYALYDYNAVELHNLYGPTECTIDVTYFDCEPDDVDPVPIGKPIYNTFMYVVDKHMQLVPMGVKGELCIGGVNVGQGYLNNTELTNEKFINNPFGDGNLYKTGDLAYWQEDGEIVFCGRIDGQIKLNGQRIETGEIEATVESVPEVEAAAVIMQRVNGRDMLVAFYCGEPNIEGKIRNACKVKLPGYMMPGVILHIFAMPLNQSGKLDRKTLSNYPINKVNTVAEKPENDTEIFICNAFEKILKIKNVGRNQDFFTLGGTSLSMISLLSEKEFENISASEFMANSTAEKLAVLMKSKRKLDLCYLKALWEPDDAKTAVVLFPFAGGGAEAYVNLTTLIKAERSDIALYFVPFLHDEEECKTVAQEIKETLYDKKIYFYSHCVGSAIAMQILQHLEADQSRMVEHYIAGAIIPQKNPIDKNIWNIVPNMLLKAILLKAGAGLNSISDEKVLEKLKQFRIDTDFSTRCFVNFNMKIKSPMSVVISKEDLFTHNWKKAEKHWKKYVEKLNKVYFIDTATHYFQSKNSDELAKIILSIID